MSHLDSSIESKDPDGRVNGSEGNSNIYLIELLVYIRLMMVNAIANSVFILDFVVVDLEQHYWQQRCDQPSLEIQQYGWQVLTSLQ